jgi:hypothetical protein
MHHNIHQTNVSTHTYTHTNTYKQWGATGALKPLKAHQVACAVYKCPAHLTDTDLLPHDVALLKGRFPAERVALTLPMVNNAREILVTVSLGCCTL